MAGSQRDPLVGSVLADDFRVLKQVGFGGYARVYIAEQISVGKRKVAVKVLHAVHAENGHAAVAALKREASYLAMLRSPCFPRIIRTGVAPNGLPYFVMEYITGRTLEAIVHDSGAMKLPRAVAILDEVCEGLAEMHSRDIVHRDIKTGNILLEEGPSGRFHVKMLDLGSAKPAYEPDPAGIRGAAQFGSPPYLAPETAATGLASDLSDIYALGALAYELVCGIRAIHIKDTRPEAYSAYLKSDQPIPTYRIATIQPSIPEGVEAVIHRALARVPSERFRSVSEFRAALLEAAGEAPPEVAGPEGSPGVGGASNISGILRKLLPFRKA